MLISQWQLQAIVDEMEKSIQKSINIMDDTGTIIASTDRSRLGQIHQGALKVIGENLDMLTIHSETCYEGSLPGVNLPILFNGSIVGVVGITGPPGEVTLFGKIIKQMTEVLIANARQQQRKKDEEAARNLFLYQWLFSDPSPLDEDTLKSQGAILHIDIHLCRAAITLKPVKADSLSLQRLLGIVKGRYPEKDGHLTIINGDQLILFYHSAAAQLSSSSLEKLKAAAQRNLQCPVALGAGCFSQNRKQLLESLRQSKAACLLSLKSPGRQIRYYHESDISFLLMEAEADSKQRFLNSLFPDTGVGDLRSYMELLATFFHCNGSVTQMAEKLFIHKNTVQYKLKKISTLTGCDPRLPSQAPTLYVALIIFEELYGILNQ